MWPEESHAPYFECYPPWRGPESKEDEEAFLNFDLEAPPELVPEVNCFLQGPAKSSGEENGRTSSPEPIVEELESWVTWRAWMHNTPGWWQELAEVPWVDDHEKLAWEVQTSFELPWQISEWHHVENYYQAPLALPCLCQKSFLPLLGFKFACQDIRELQQEKTVAYAKALQFWVEKANLPTQGQPCPLAGSVMELREEMKCYVSFTDEDVFSGVTLSEEPLITQPKEAAPKSAQPTQADSPVKEAFAKVTKEPTKKEKNPELVSWVEGGVTPLQASSCHQTDSPHASCIIKDKAIWGDLQGHHYHFNGVSGPQWPRAGGLDSGAHHRGHHRPHVAN